MKAYAIAAIEAATEQGKRQPLTPAEIGEFVGNHNFGPLELKWFRYGEAAQGITATPQGKI